MPLIRKLKIFLLAVKMQKCSTSETVNFCFLTLNYFPDCGRSQHRVPQRSVGSVPYGHRLSGARLVRQHPGREHTVRRQHSEGNNGRGGGGR